MVSFIRKLVENLQDEIISNHLILVLRALIAYMHIFPAAARLLCQTAVFKFCTGSLKLISANLIHALSAGMETRLDKTETGECRVVNHTQHNTKMYKLIWCRNQYTKEWKKKNSPFSQASLQNLHISIYNIFTLIHWKLFITQGDILNSLNCIDKWTVLLKAGFGNSVWQLTQYLRWSCRHPHWEASLFQEQTSHSLDLEGKAT